MLSEVKMWDLDTIKRRNRAHFMERITDEEIKTWRSQHGISYWHDTDDEIRGYIADEWDTEEEYS